MAGKGAKVVMKKYDNHKANELLEQGNFNELFTYVSQFADSKEPQALLKLADCYYFGYGTDKNFDMCFKYDKAACDIGDADGIARLGFDYKHGIGVAPNLNQALNLYNKSIKLGSARGQRYLGNCYEYGTGVEKDEYTAFEWYAKSAQQGDSSGQRCLGKCYEYGIGIEKNERTAFEWYAKSAQQGDSISQQYVGECYEFGIGVEKDEHTAFEWYTKSAHRGNSEGQRLLGLCYEYGTGIEKNEPAAFEWYKKSAQQGNAKGQRCLGVCYEHGTGIEKNEHTAFEWYLKSAKQGDSEGQRLLGLCYEYGTGIEKNEPAAFEWYKKSAQQGNAVGQRCLGICYEYGTGVEKNEHTAFEWYLKSAKQGDSISQYYVGQCYEHGSGVEKNELSALEWYQYASDNNEAHSTYDIAEIYKRSTTVIENFPKAIKYYKLAAEQYTDSFEIAECYKNIGDCYKEIPNSDETANNFYKKAIKIYISLFEKNDGKATLRLGLMYRDGLGVSCDYQKAFEYFEHANLLLDDGYSNFMLARCYENGNGVSINKKTAFDLYQKASDKEFKIATLYLGYCFERGIGVKKNINKALEIYRENLEVKSPWIKATANLYMGRVYYHGIGVSTNLDTALTYFEKDPALGLEYANLIKGNKKLANFLGYLYSSNSLANKFYLTADHSKAIYFLNMALEENTLNEYGAITLSMYYRTGKYVKRNNQNSFKIITYLPYEKLENGKSLRCIAEHYYYGCGVKKNYHLAMKYFEAAFYKSDYISELYLALCYAYGNGVPQNYGKAREFLQDSADHNSEAKALLGLLTYSGEWGIKKSKHKGLEILKSDCNIIYYYDLLKTTHGEAYLSLCINTLIKKLYWRFDPKAIFKQGLPYLLKLIVLFIIKNPNSSRITKKEIMKELMEIREDNRELRAINENSAQQLMTLLNQLNNNVNNGFNSLSEQLIKFEVFVKNELCNEIRTAKTELENLIKEYPEKNEKLISKFINEQAQYINTKSRNMNELITSEEKHLKNLFGSKWEKLDNTSQSSLCSAGVLWTSCAEISDPLFDYSGICISTTSALELELKRCFYYGFQQYIYNKYGEPTFDTWPEILLSHTKIQFDEFLKNHNNKPSKYKKPILSKGDGDDFTMGSLPYILGKKKTRNSTQDKLLDKLMNEYLAIIINISSSAKLTTLFYKTSNETNNDKKLVEKCDDIRNNYRNPAAHTNIMSKEKAGECYTQVIGKIDSFNYQGEVISLLLQLYDIIDIDKLSLLLREN